MINQLLVALTLFFIVLLAWVWAYLQRLERTGCACAADYRRTYIMWYIGLRILLLLASMFVPCLVTYGIFMVPLDVVFVMFTLQYVRRLEHIKCECSQHLARDVLWMAAVLKSVSYVIGIVLGLLLVLWVCATAMKNGDNPTMTESLERIRRAAAQTASTAVLKSTAALKLKRRSVRRSRR